MVLMMETTVDSQVLEQKKLTLRLDTGHTGPENGGSGCSVFGDVDGSGRAGAVDSVCFTLAAAVRAERS